MSKKSIIPIFAAVTANGTSAIADVSTQSRRTIQATITGTGAVSATVTWFGSNNNTTSGGILLATSTLSGTTTDTSGADIRAEWPYMYCVLASISGTNATVTATIAI